MSCTNPLYMQATGRINQETGKPIYAFVPYGKVTDENRHQFLAVPCGRCMECRLQYARTWANRCMLEAKDHEFNWFVTLTYDSDHVPIGKDGKSFTLVVCDIQLFFKQLRNLSGQSFRYFGCGEYGEKYFRPHYHYIIFGLELHDLVPWRRNGLKNTLYRSELLERVWQKGHVEVGFCTWDSCCYVSRYVTKKLKGDDAFIYADLGIKPPFVTMSRRPGIGLNYYLKNADKIYKNDKIILGTDDGSIEFTPPRYFDERLKVDNPERYAEIKEQREVNGFLAQFQEESATDLDFKSYQILKDEAIKNRSKSLERRLD